MSVKMKTEDRRWDVFIVEDATRKIEKVIGTSLRETGSFHTVDKRIDLYSDRINDAFSVIAVKAGRFSVGDAISKKVKTYG